MFRQFCRHLVRNTRSVNKMWKNPQLLYQEMVMGKGYRLIVAYLAGIDQLPELPRNEGNEAFAKAEEVFCLIHKQTLSKTKAIVKKYRLKSGQVLCNHHLESINKCFFDQCLTIALEIERTRNYRLVADMWVLWYRTFSRRYHLVIDDDPMSPLNCYFKFNQTALTLIHKLVGTESKTLVGTKDKSPVFLSHKPVLNLSDVAKPSLPITVQLAHIGHEDFVMLPRYDSFDRNALSDQTWPKIRSFRPILDILEDAYKNMRYMPNPSGSYIKINGIPRVQGAMIKVLPPKDNPDGFGLMARLDFDTGSHLMIENDVVEHIQQSQDGLPDGNLPPYGFFLWLACQVYHDMVTAKEIRTGPSKDLLDSKPQKSVPTPTNRWDDYNPEWTYIPRIVKGTEEPIRLPVPMLTEYTPRYVRGHIRKGKMTEEHRQALERFEAETGLKIIYAIKDGFTFVRPHISPAIDRAEWDGLPKYIKARIQDDFDLLLKTEQAER